MQGAELCFQAQLCKSEVDRGSCNSAPGYLTHSYFHDCVNELVTHQDFYWPRRSGGIHILGFTRLHRK